MMMCNRSLVCALACLLLALSWSSSRLMASNRMNLESLKKLLPEQSGKELRMSFKVFLTKMKIRQVPLAKARSERLLTKLYRDERLIKDKIMGLERNLEAVSDKTRRHSLRVLEVERPKESTVGSGPRRNLMKVSELTQSRIDDWLKELEEAKREFADTRANIEQAKNIIKDPESYISIPSNYGHEDPEVVQERERELLIKDRINMNYRADVESGEEEPPLWMSDKW